MLLTPAPPECSMRGRAVAWTLYGITVTQLGDLTDTVMTLDAGGTVRPSTSSACRLLECNYACFHRRVCCTCFLPVDANC